MKTPIKQLLVLSLSFLNVQAASQLAPFYQSVVKYHETGVVPADMDLSKLVPSEEIPTMITAINSGNLILMKAAVTDARDILRIHINDAQVQKRLQPPLAEVMQEFQALVPVVSAHFDDPQALDGGANGTTDDYEIQWKTLVVQYMDAQRAQPTPEMLMWMLKIVQWPNDGGRAETAAKSVDDQRVAIGLPSNLPDIHAAILETTRRNERVSAIKILPVLCHLTPMPAAVWNTLTAKINDNSEPQAAKATTLELALNPHIDHSKLADVLTTVAFAKNASVDIRVAAIQGIGFIGAPWTEKLRGLDHDPDPLIRDSIYRIGFANIELVEQSSYFPWVLMEIEKGHHPNGKTYFTHRCCCNRSVPG